MSLNANDSRAAKAALRRTLLARRSGVTPSEALRAAGAVRKLVETIPRWRAAREVMVYMAFGGEIGTEELVQGLLDRGARVLAPRCRPDEAGALDVACVTCLSQLSPGAYGILEPRPDACPALSRVCPDVALIPAVAFDRRGGRLGFGQGYYDRLLAAPGFENTLLIGLAHSFQVVDELPLDPWDRPVHVVVTEDEVIQTA